MHLKELLERHGQASGSSVPDWVMGCFQRRSITFANGLTDNQTLVFWLQSRNITIDLRLPIESEQVAAKRLGDYDEKELRTLANYEGWYAESSWQDGWLSWSGGTSFQIHNRWPEPASLVRVGDCMMEFSPDASYIEEWRILSRKPGPLVGLRLIVEEDLKTGRVRHRDGALIINGGFAGLVLGRAKDLNANISEHQQSKRQLRDLVSTEQHREDLLQDVFDFETSVAVGDLASGFFITHSTRARRLQRALFPLDGFEFDTASNEIIHVFIDGDTTIKRRFSIDTCEENFPFSGSTPLADSTTRWLNFEHETLGRYLKMWERE